MFSKWLPMEAAILKLSLKFKIMELNLFLKNMPTHTLLTTTIFAYYVNTGHSRYVDFAYLDTTTYFEEIFHSQHFFSIFLCISTPSMSKTINMK